jgi:hypothetical protein
VYLLVGEGGGGRGGYACAGRESSAGGALKAMPALLPHGTTQCLRAAKAAPLPQCCTLQGCGLLRRRTCLTTTTKPGRSTSPRHRWASRRAAPGADEALPGAQPSACTLAARPRRQPSPPPTHTHHHHPTHTHLDHCAYRPAPDRASSKRPAAGRVERPEPYPPAMCAPSPTHPPPPLLQVPQWKGGDSDEKDVPDYGLPPHVAHRFLGGCAAAGRAGLGCIPAAASCSCHNAQRPLPSGRLLPPSRSPAKGGLRCQAAELCHTAAK